MDAADNGKWYTQQEWLEIRKLLLDSCRLEAKYELIDEGWTPPYQDSAKAVADIKVATLMRIYERIVGDEDGCTIGGWIEEEIEKLERAAEWMSPK